MSSLALYRRYRPETFAEVIGQEHVTDPLQQALRNNRVNHAYLFSGPRGCGKTTSARILARCLNCERGPTPQPCGECRSCRDLARNGPGSIDVIEIDAASHGGVDDARELREKAFFGPAASRYKIYIVDEAHMVTPAGFNALLKVVEEPPEHLKFIFATTEPEKVIGTIRSRTHHYPFRLVPPGTLRDYLAQVCRQEEIPVEDTVLPLVVRAGAGSVRDSMSVMDQLLAGAGAEGVTYAMATALLGYTDGALLDAVVDAFAAQDGAAAFEVVDRVIEGGHDPRRFVADLLERLRDLVILAAVPDAAERALIDAPQDVLERMGRQAQALGPAQLSRAADLVNTGLTEMRGATSPRLQLELICARVLLPAAYGDEGALLSRLERLERGAALGGGMPPAPQPAAQPVPQPAAPPVARPPAAAEPVREEPRPAAPEEQPAGAPGRQRPGAWPGAGGRGADAPAGGQRPGAWPGGGGGGAPAPAQPAPAPAPAAAAQQATPAASGSGGAGAGGDPSRVRQMWPQILDAVKSKRRFTWILLSQNAEVSGFDGTTLQVAFSSAGARDSFVGGGSEDVLRQALADAFGVQWKVEAVVGPGSGAGGGGAGGGGGGAGAVRAAGPPPPPAPAPASAPPPAGPGPRPAERHAPAPAATSAAAPAPAAAQAPPPRSPAPEPSAAPMNVEDDVPEDDDPDLDDRALSGTELLVEGLGATVIEEIEHEG
ncbi:DNA polymerase III subunit gamma and tau [Streptomyces aidingensis]|uniref:DNA polymerase III subunit gamma and tau n=1 Tax=Streptomyces aidingensis TaxID=910347 RepID=UPI000B85D9FB|nr:DNA polymerase III subunit gamma and tau [Streptomyces aidingensis]